MVGVQIQVANSGTLTLNGTGTNHLIISGNNMSRVLLVNPGVTLLASNLNITKGNGVGNIDSGIGGGIYIAKDSNVILTNIYIESNSASSNGGGVFNAGTLTINQGSIIGNSANGSMNDYGKGGGICNYEGNLTLDNSFVGSNHVAPGSNSQYGGYGGGIYNYQGITTINTSAVVVNSAERSKGNGSLTTYPALGGGIYNSKNGIMFINNSGVYGNQVDGNGAGINNNRYSKLTITNSTISDNSAFGDQGIGGGIVNFAVINLTNVTITSNTASIIRGGVDHNEIDDSVVNSRNTIIAGNNISNGFGGLSPDDFHGKLTSYGFNLIGNTTGMTITGISTGNLLNTNPLLDPNLVNNGGPTLTHALLSGSPAINAGDNTNASLTDQRGFARIVGGTIDIGAFEFAPVKSRKRVRFF